VAMLSFGVEDFGTMLKGTSAYVANGLWLQAHYSHAIEFVDGVAELFLHVADAV
jgi:hypothetical protein